MKHTIKSIAAIFAAIVISGVQGCTNQEPEEVLAKSVTLSKATLELTEGDQVPLEATVLPETTSDKSVVWSSSKESVATVTSDGVVEAIAVGKAYIIATNKPSGKSAMCEVKVISKSATASVSIEKLTPNSCTFKGHIDLSTSDVAFSKITIYYSESEPFNINTAESASTTSFDSDHNFEIELSNLKSSTTYQYCLLTEVRGEKTYGDVKSFTTPAIVASVTAEASDVSYHTAAISGKLTIDSEGSFKKSAVLYYSTTASTVDQLKSSGTKKTLSLQADGSYSIRLSSLVPDTKYNYVVVSNVDDVQQQTDVKSFTTPAIVASVSAESSDIECKSAVISGKLTIDSEGSFTKSAVLYYSTAASTVEQLKSGGTKEPLSLQADGSYSVSLSSLVPDTKYNYVVVSNVDDVEFASVLYSFGTKSVPSGAVDLGLSVVWATCNIGAESPEQYGDYYAWGETEEKSYYDWSTYKWCKGSYNTMTKYCTQSSYGNNGFTDNKTVLEPDDDVAHVKLGGSWRMPTYKEWEELRNTNNCSWTWTENYDGTGVKGYIVKSKKSGYTDRSIFLPAAGCLGDSYLSSAGSYGFYWSSSLYTGLSYYARLLDFSSGYVGAYRSSRDRYNGQSVRPVSE